MKILESIKDRLTGAKSAAHQAVDIAQAAVQAGTQAGVAVRELREQIAQLRRQMHDIEAAPLPPKDVAALARLVVAARRKVVTDLWQQLLFLDSALASPRNRHPEQTQLPKELDWLTALCVEDPARAERLLVQVVEVAAIGHEDVIGPAAAERPAMLAELRSALETIEAEEERLVDTLKAEKVLQIEHRPEVLERRASSQRAQVFQDESVPARKSREVTIDDSHRRAVRSDYLSGGGRLRNDAS